MNNEIMGYYNNLFSVDPTTSIGVEDLVLTIKNPTSEVESLCRQISKLNNGEVTFAGSPYKLTENRRNMTALKKQLPCVTISGTFSGKRTRENLKEKSGLMQLDFDNVRNVDEFKQALTHVEFILAAFLSPSGSGLKVIVRYEGDHNEAFILLCDYFKKYYEVEPDKSCKDLCRLMFLSHDPDCYYNPNALICDRYLRAKMLKRMQRFIRRILVVKWSAVIYNLC